MPTKTVRFLLSEIELYYDGDKFVDEGKPGRKPYSAKYVKDPKKFDNLLEARLEYPRSGAPVVTTTKLMDLPSRRRIQLNTADFWEAGLFKEDVDSETRFRMTVSDRDSVSGFARWFRKILSGMFKLAVGSKVKAISNVFQGAVATDLQSRIEGGLTGDQKDSGITVLCTCKDVHIELTANGFDAYIMKGKRRIDVKEGSGFTVDLLAASTVKKTVRKERRSGSNIPKKVQEVVFRKNQKMGEAKVTVVGA
ncbi:MAG: hypothetical protein AAF351_06890 [Pseudomonadota bacterium]